MTAKEYKEMIAASGGLTPRKEQCIGERPHSLKAEDEHLLTKAWKRASKSAKEIERSEKAKEKQSA